MPISADPVLKSKITVPALPDWIVHRERISTLIAQGARGPLTVITGPPGAGKSVALASCVAGGSLPQAVAWVRLDTFDNRPGTFWSHVIEALRRAGTAVSADLPALSAGSPALFLRNLAEAVSGPGSPVALVLDDFHLLTRPGVVKGLAYVLRHAGCDLRLLVASRTEPALPLHQYRLNGELTEIRGKDLAFTTAETALLLARHGITLAPQSLADMTRRCEGWVAGLRLAALSMDGHPDPEQLVGELAATDGPIARYFAEEILRPQPARVRKLLLQASVLDRVNVGLASELAGSAAIGHTIPALARANAFVQPIGNGWYRLHPLFSEVLRLKLRHESPHQVPRLHRRAARWLSRHGTLTEAIDHAAAAGDWHLAARMTVGELAVGALLDPEAGQPLAAALRMPADPDPRDRLSSLIVASAMALRYGQDGACRTWLTRAEDLLWRRASNADVSSRMAAALVRMALASRHGDGDALTAAAARASSALGMLPADLLARRPEARAEELSWRGTAHLWAGRFDDAAATLARGDDAEVSGCAGRLALVEALSGRLSNAVRLATAACKAAVASRGGQSRTVGAAEEIALACVHAERHRLSAATARLSSARRALRQNPDRLLGAVACLVAARVNQARGRPRAAAEILRRAGDGWSPPRWLGERLGLAEACARAAAGDARAALDAAARAGPPSTLPGAVALARVRLAAAGPRTSARVLAGAGPATAETPDYLKLEVWLLEAELSYGTGDAGRGRLVLAQALKYAATERVLLPFVIQRRWIEPILRPDAGLAAAFGDLLGQAEAVTSRRRQPSAPSADAPAVTTERLSDREVEVLRLASRMLSTKEIAWEMHLSAETIKSHLRNIFRKLGVSRRREAVYRARQLALL